METLASRFDAQECLKALALIESDLDRLASASTEAQFHAPPRTGGWSIGHCIEHLTLTGEAFTAKWDTAIKQGISLNGDRANTLYPWWQRKLLGIVEPPYRMKSKTGRSFEPSSPLPKEKTIRQFRSMHQEFMRAIDRSRSLDTQRTKMQSPFVTWIWYPLGFSFDLVLAHERRHLWQAWQVYRHLLSGIRVSGANREHGTGT